MDIKITFLDVVKNEYVEKAFYNVAQCYFDNGFLFIELKNKDCIMLNKKYIMQMVK